MKMRKIHAPCKWRGEISIHIFFFCLNWAIKWLGEKSNSFANKLCVDRLWNELDRQNIGASRRQSCLRLLFGYRFFFFRSSQKVDSQATISHSNAFHICLLCSCEGVRSLVIHLRWHWNSFNRINLPFRSVIFTKNTLSNIQSLRFWFFTLVCVCWLVAFMSAVNETQQTHKFETKTIFVKFNWIASSNEIMLFCHFLALSLCFFLSTFTILSITFHMNRCESHILHELSFHCSHCHRNRKC